MIGRQHEIVHNTDEQVREYVRKGLELLDELEVPDELRAVVFERAVNLFASKQVVVEAVQPGAIELPNLRAAGR
jgi:hypothetical protein